VEASPPLPVGSWLASVLAMDAASHAVRVCDADCAGYANALPVKRGADPACIGFPDSLGYPDCTVNADALAVAVNIDIYHASCQSGLVVQQPRWFLD
jgi:hypothetical protein